MMTTEQTKMLTEALTQLRTSAEELTRDLSIRVLDGTPFVIVGEFKTPGSEEPITLVYGEWQGHGKCFRALSVQPHHFGGVYTMSADSADKAIAKLNSDPDNKLVNPRRLHIREVKQSRLAELNAAIAHIEAMVKTGESLNQATV